MSKWQCRAMLLYSQQGPNALPMVKPSKHSRLCVLAHLGMVHHSLCAFAVVQLMPND